MIRIRQQAGVVFPEEPIAITRDAIISPIPKKARDGAQHQQRASAGRQLRNDFKHRLRTLPILPVADHGEGVELIQRQPGPGQ